MPLVAQTWHGLQLQLFKQYILYCQNINKDLVFRTGSRKLAMSMFATSVNVYSLTSFLAYIFSDQHRFLSSANISHRGFTDDLAFMCSDN